MFRSGWRARLAGFLPSFARLGRWDTCSYVTVATLKLPRVILGPALDHDFLFRIELDGVASLGVHNSEKAVFPAAEREVGHRRGDANVDANIARRRFVTEPAGGRAAGREQRRLIAVRTALQEGKRFVQVIGMHHAQYRTEDFGFGQITSRGNTVEDRWLYEVSGFAFRNSRVAAIEQNLRSLLLAGGDQRLNPCLALRRDDRPHLYAFVEAVSYPQRRGRLGNRIAEGLLCLADRYRYGHGQATLAGATESAVPDDLRGHLHVRIGQYDDVVLGPALALGALATLPRARIHVPGHGRGTDETDGPNRGMIKQGVDRGLAAIHHVHHTLGQSD